MRGQRVKGREETGIRMGKRREKEVEGLSRVQ
jgi:hypothetical protein